MRIPLDSRLDLVGPENQPKVLCAGDEWLGEDQPYVFVDDQSVRISGNLDNGVVVDSKGTTIQGPLSILGMPEDIRIGSYWAMNPMLICSIGSSAAMPVPTLVPTKPPLLEPQNDFADIIGGL